MVTPDKKSDIKDIPIGRFEKWLVGNGIEPYRSGQVYKWIYHRQTDSFDEMTDLSKGLRNSLAAQFRISRLDVDRVDTSSDGTKKILFRLDDGNHIESVLIPEGTRRTLCISCQVGCAMGCRFCLTGKGGLVRDLSPGEIIAQVRDIPYRSISQGKITHIVFMGMGEPLGNYANVIQAISTLTDMKTGMGFSGRRITVSTSGLAPLIPDFLRDTAAHLAISLNAADDSTRSRLMPINRRYGTRDVIDACKAYQIPKGRHITFEYVLIKGLNDAPEDALRLSKLLRPLRCKINLIPFNSFEGSGFECPDAFAVEAFKHALEKSGYTAIIRNSRGSDILAACGQLRGSLSGERQDEVP